MTMLHAYFLHTRPYRETSLLVDAFTAESGLVSGVMRGGRGSKKTSLQLFQPMMLELAGKGDLKTIRQAEPAGMALLLQGVNLFSAFYVNELLVRLLPKEEVQTSFFAMYGELLANLASSQAPALLLRRFELELLEVLGYAIDFAHDSETDDVVRAEQFYHYQPERGFFPVLANHALTRGSVLLQIAEGNLQDSEPARIAKQVNRLALAHLLGPRPLKSRELFLSSRS